jgi:GTP-binding protein
VSYQIVLTKSDKIKPTDLTTLMQRTQLAIAKQTAAYPLIIATSSEVGTGIDDLRAQAARVTREHS